MACAISLPEPFPSEFEFSEDDTIDDDEGSVPRLTPTLGLARQGPISLEWTSSIPQIDSDVSDRKSIHSPTPLPRSATLLLSPACAEKPRIGPPASFWFDEEVEVNMLGFASLVTVQAIRAHTQASPSGNGLRPDLVALLRQFGPVSYHGSNGASPIRWTALETLMILAVSQYQLSSLFYYVSGTHSPLFLCTALLTLPQPPFRCLVPFSYFSWFRTF